MRAKWLERWIEIDTQFDEESERWLYGAIECGRMEIEGRAFSVERPLIGCCSRKIEAYRRADQHAVQHDLAIWDRATDEWTDEPSCGPVAMEIN